MKKRIFTVILCGMLILSAAGCSKNGQITAEDIAAENVSCTDVSTVSDDDEDELIIKIVADATEKESEIIDSSETAGSETITVVQTQTIQTDPPENTGSKETTDPTQSQSSAATATEPKTEPVTHPKTETETVTQPQTEPQTEPQTDPPTEPQTERATEPFDINYWISFAQNYASSIGLNLNSNAVYCWDNPIVAGPRSMYLERDIKSSLDYYKRNANITDIWIWADPRGDGSYDLILGYG